jgi:hypothetical protein
MNTTTAPAQETVPTEVSDDEHYCCCRSERGAPVKTLCGLIDHEGWTGDRAPVSCVLCCLAHEAKQCPVYGRCLEGGG